MTEAENNTDIQISKPVKKFRNGVIYIIVLAMILAVCAVQAVHQLTNSISATIRIDSVYAADGKNPDGSPFSIMELFGEEVLYGAVEKLDHKMTVQELRSHLDITDTMSVNSYNQLEQSVSNGVDENNYSPTEYRLTYSIISRQVRDKGILAQIESLLRSFSLPSKSEILSAVLMSYQEYYSEKYLHYDSLFHVDWADVDAMDYYNRYEILDDKLQQMTRFFQYRINNQTSLDAECDDSGYRDLLAEVNNSLAQDLMRYQAYVIQNGVTFDRQTLLRQFKYMERLTEEEKNRNLQEYHVLREAVELYDSTTTRVVFIPSLDGERSFYMNRTKVGLDYLTEMADNAKLLADKAAADAKHYQYLQKCFGESVDFGETETGDRAYADGLYQHLKEDIQMLIDKTELLVQNEGMVGQQLLVGSPYCSVSIVSAALSSMKKFAFLLMAAYVVGYTVHVVMVKMNEKKTGVK